MRTLSVTGASGFIGRRLLAVLARRDDVAIRALVHGTPAGQLPYWAQLTWVRGDLSNTSSLKDLLRPGDDLVDLAYPLGWSSEQRLSAATQLARMAVAAGMRRIVHCSTAVVVGRTAECRITETTPPRPVTEYERTKLALENIWQDACRGQAELAILRPTAVFGPHGRNLLKLAHDLERQPRFANYLKSSLQGNRRMNLVHVDNVVAALWFLASADTAVTGETYLISDDEAPANNYRDVERRLMAGLGIPDYTPAPLPVLHAALPLALRLAGRTNADPDRTYDCSKIMKLGLVKALDFERALADFLAWYRRRGPSVATP